MNPNPTTIKSLPLHLKTPVNISQVALSEGVYHGELQDFIRTGKGIFLWSNGDIYFGEWQGNKMHGKGIFCFNTGIYIEGYFQNDRVESLAYVHYPDKSYLKGIFHNGRLVDRALIYNSVEDIWYIKDYTSENNPIIYEGKGKPVAFDYSRFSATSRELLKDSRISTTSHDEIETIKQEIWSNMKSNLGCFETEPEVKHFGTVKDGVIQGPGLRINGKCIEMGNYQNNELNGNGQRIEFGAQFYKGEFLDGFFNGQGVLFDWNRNKRAKGTFQSGRIIECRTECSFTIEDFDVLNNLFEYAKPLESKTLSHLNIRSYKSAFPAFNIINSRDVSSLSIENQDSGYQATTVKEGVKSLILKESVISTQITPYLPKSHLNLDISMNDPSLNVKDIALSMEKSPENIEKALDRAKKCINYLSQKLDNYVTVPRPLSTCLETEEGSDERRFSQAFSIEVKSKFKNHSRAKSQENLHHQRAMNNVSNNENDNSETSITTNNEQRKRKKSIGEIWKATNENSKFRLIHQYNQYNGYFQQQTMENRKETELNLSQDFNIKIIPRENQEQPQEKSLEKSSESEQENKDFITVIQPSSSRHLRSLSMSNSEASLGALTSRNILTSRINSITPQIHDKENFSNPSKLPSKISSIVSDAVDTVEYNMTKGVISPQESVSHHHRRESSLSSALRETNSNIPKNWTPRTLSIELLPDSHRDTKSDLTTRRLEHNNSTKTLLKPQTSLVSLHNKQSKIPNKENMITANPQKAPVDSVNNNNNIRVGYMFSPNTERNLPSSPQINRNPSTDCITTQRLIKREPLSERSDEANHFMTKRQSDLVETNHEVEIEANIVKTRRGDHRASLGSGLHQSASQPVINNMVQSVSENLKTKPGNMTLFRPKSKEISLENNQIYGMDHHLLNTKMKTGHSKGKLSGHGLEASGLSRTGSKAQLSGNSLGGSFWDKGNRNLNISGKKEGKMNKRANSQISLKPEQKSSKKVSVNLPVNKTVQSPRLSGSKSSYFSSQKPSQNSQSSRIVNGPLKEITIVHPGGSKTQRHNKKELHNTIEPKSNISEVKKQLSLTARNPIKLELTHTKRASLAPGDKKPQHGRQSSVGNSALKKVLKPSGSTFSLEKTTTKKSFSSGVKSKMNASTRESGQYSIGNKEISCKEKESPIKILNEKTQEDYYPVKKTCEGCGINSPDILSKTSSPRLKSASSPKHYSYHSANKEIHHENDEDPLLSAMKEHREKNGSNRYQYNNEPLTKINQDFPANLMLKCLNSPKAMNFLLGNANSNTFSLSQRNLEDTFTRSNGSVIEYNTLQKYNSPKSPQMSLHEIDPLKHGGHGQLESVNIKQVESYFGHEPSLQEDKVFNKFSEGFAKKKLSIEIPADNEQTTTNQCNNNNLHDLSKKNPSFDLDISLVKTLDKIVKKPFTNAHSASLYQLASEKRKENSSMTFGSMSKIKPAISAYVGEESINGSSIDEHGRKQGDSLSEEKEGGNTKRKLGALPNAKQIYKSNYFKQNYIRKEDQKDTGNARGVISSHMDSAQSRGELYEINNLQRQNQETIEESDVPDEGHEACVYEMEIRKQSLKEIQGPNNRLPLKPKIESESEVSSWNYSKEISQNSGDM